MPAWPKRSFTQIINLYLKLSIIDQITNGQTAVSQASKKYNVSKRAIEY
ncbi:hypothetical protein DDV96_13650 [Marixanthomonas spongiae]|uniref:HTH psq-type domain-containing protein n=1 Tax=Marixanthomonas spongiae TaxID=2174845 RepID=A0A2U0HXF0_9FLAO|nr:hypothetical protein DDV96_13650 [Marixanthomonas spongiae]